MAMVRCYMMTDRQGWTDTSRERDRQRKWEEQEGRNGKEYRRKGIMIDRRQKEKEIGGMRWQEDSEQEKRRVREAEKP